MKRKRQNKRPQGEAPTLVRPILDKRDLEMEKLRKLLKIPKDKWRKGMIR